METLKEMLDYEEKSLGEYLVRQSGRFARLRVREEEIQEGLDLIKGEVYGREDHREWTYVDGDAVRVNISGLKSWGEVGEYLRVLIKGLGGRLEDKQRGDLHYYCKVGVFRFRFDIDGEGATCRKVQVGTRTEEVPVYEVVCD